MSLFMGLSVLMLVDRAASEMSSLQMAVSSFTPAHGTELFINTWTQLVRQLQGEGDVAAESDLLHPQS